MLAIGSKIYSPRHSSTDFSSFLGSENEESLLFNRRAHTLPALP